MIIRPASSQAQDMESSPVKDQRSTTVLRRQLYSSNDTFKDYLSAFPAPSTCNASLLASLSLPDNAKPSCTRDQRKLTERFDAADGPERNHFAPQSRGMCWQSPPTVSAASFPLLYRPLMYRRTAPRSRRRRRRRERVTRNVC